MLDRVLLHGSRLVDGGGTNGHVVRIKVLVPVEGVIGLGSEFLLAFWLRIHPQDRIITIVFHQSTVVLLDGCNAVGLALGLILDHFDGVCARQGRLRCFVFALLLAKTLVPGEFAENEVLICVSFIFLDQEVISRCEGVVLIHLNLLLELLEPVEELELRRGCDF